MKAITCALSPPPTKDLLPPLIMPSPYTTRGAEQHLSDSASEVEETEHKPHENFLKKHAAFFDRNKDGLVYPSETFRGFRAIGSGLFLSAAAALFINGALSGKTRPGKPFSLWLPIEVENIHLAMHGSDSGVYDSEGRFLPWKFEEIFRNHARTHPNALTSKELNAMLKANRDPKDYGGWVGAWTEWKFLHNLCKDENGLLRKETVRAAYDGSLFEHLETERSQGKKTA